MEYEFDINEKEFKKDEKKLRKSYKEKLVEWGDDDHPGFHIEDKPEYANIGLEDNGDVYINCGTKYGSMSITITPDAKFLGKIVNLTIKKLNKFKTVMEGLS